MQGSQQLQSQQPQLQPQQPSPLVQRLQTVSNKHTRLTQNKVEQQMVAQKEITDTKILELQEKIKNAQKILTNYQPVQIDYLHRMVGMRQYRDYVAQMQNYIKNNTKALNIALNIQLKQEDKLQELRSSTTYIKASPTESSSHVSGKLEGNAGAVGNGGKTATATGKIYTNSRRAAPTAPISAAPISAAPTAPKTPKELKESTKQLSTQNLTPDYKQQQTDEKQRLDEEIESLKANPKPQKKADRVQYNENLKKEINKLYYKKHFIEFNLSYLTQKEEMAKLLDNAAINGIELSKVTEITKKTDALNTTYLTSHSEYEIAVLKETEAEKALHEIKAQQQAQMTKTQMQDAVKAAELAVKTASDDKTSKLFALQTACNALEDNTNKLTTEIRTKKYTKLYNEGIVNPVPPQFTALKSLQMLVNNNDKIDEEYIASQDVKIRILNKKKNDLQQTKKTQGEFQTQTPENIEINKKKVLQLQQTADIINYDLKYLIAQKKAAKLTLTKPMPEIAQYLQARTKFEEVYNSPNSSNEKDIAKTLQQVAHASYKLENKINSQSDSTSVGSGFFAGLGSVSFAGLL
jgi:hypothetical protein